MMYKYGKIDANQKEIVEQLRQIPGVSVKSTSSLGDGFVDLVIGYKARNYLIELKDENKPPSGKKLTEAEEKFHAEWTGQVAKCESLSEILKAINHV